MSTPHLALLFLFSLFSLFSLSFAHNRLISPTPWNPSPIKVAPCGGGISLTSPQAYWYTGSNATVQWVAIGDGTLPLNISIDPTGGTTFTTLLFQNGTVNLGNNYYTFIVPDVVCTGVNDTCSIQVISEDGWSACTSVTILPACNNCSPQTPPGPTCTLATGLQFCSQYNNTSISLGAGFNAAALDLMVNESLFEYSYGMPTFLTNGTTAACQSSFKALLCSLVFPSCNKGILSCQDDCSNFKRACGLVSTHSALYNCTALPKCASKDKPKYEQAVIFTGISITVVIVLAFVLNFVVCKRVKAQYTPIQ